MSKKNRSTAKRGNKRSVNGSKKRIQATKPSRSSRIIRFLVNQLVSIVVKAIFEQRIKEILSWIGTWLIG